MLKNISLALIALLAMASVEAQDRTGSEFGIQGGPGFSLFYNQHPVTNPRNPLKPTLSAPAFGLTYQYNFPKIISIRAEANFERKGDFIYYTASYLNSEGLRINSKNYAYDRVGYLSIPVMARLSFGKKIQFFTNVGLYTAFRTDAVRTMSAINYGSPEGNTTTETITSADLSNDIRKVDGGLVTGLGVSIPLWKMLTFSFEARNNMGFTDLNSNSPVYQNRFYNNSTVFLIGLAAHMGRPMRSKDQLK